MRCRQTAEIVAAALGLARSARTRACGPAWSSTTSSEPAAASTPTRETVLALRPPARPLASWSPRSPAGGSVEFRKGSLAVLGLEAARRGGGRLRALYPPAALRGPGSRRELGDRGEDDPAARAPRRRSRRGPRRRRRCRAAPSAAPPWRRAAAGVAHSAARGRDLPRGARSAPRASAHGLVRRRQPDRRPRRSSAARAAASRAARRPRSPPRAPGAPPRSRSASVGCPAARVTSRAASARWSGRRAASSSGGQQRRRTRPRGRRRRSMRWSWAAARTASQPSGLRTGPRPGRPWSWRSSRRGAGVESWWCASTSRISRIQPCSPCSARMAAPLGRDVRPQPLQQLGPTDLKSLIYARAVRSSSPGTRPRR